MLLVAGVNMLLALITLIYAGVGMSEFSSEKHAENVNNCYKESAPSPYSAPDTCEKLNAQQCGQETCYTGSYCAKDKTSKIIGCSPCYGATPSLATAVGIGNKYVEGVNLQCGKGNRNYLVDFNVASQQREGLYMCKSSAECVGVACIAPKGEADRLEAFCEGGKYAEIDVTTSDFKAVGGREAMATCFVPAVVAAVFVILTGVPMIIAGVAGLGNKDCAKSLSWFSVASTVVGALVSLICMFVLIGGKAGFDEKVAPFIQDFVENDAPITDNQPLSQQDLKDSTDGTAVGGCPKSCHAAKYVAPAYLEGFVAYSSVLLALLVFMMLIGISSVFVSCLGVKADDDGGDGPAKAYKPKPYNKKQGFQKQITMNTPTAKRIQSMASRAAPAAPGNAGRRPPVR